MNVESRQQRERKDATSALNAAIQAMDLAKRLSTITSAKDLFGTVSDTLKMLRVSSFRLLSMSCRLEYA